MTFLLITLSSPGFQLETKTLLPTMVHQLLPNCRIILFFKLVIIHSPSLGNLTIQWVAKYTCFKISDALKGCDLAVWHGIPSIYDPTVKDSNMVLPAENKTSLTPTFLSFIFTLLLGIVSILMQSLKIVNL